MILKSSMFKYIILFGTSVLALPGFGQEKTVQDTTDTPATMEEVEVIRDYRPILADAVKIRQSPDMSNMRKYQPELQYDILDKRLNLPSGMRPLRIQQMPTERPENMYPNYVKAGVGNYNSYLGELYINTAEDAYIQAGGYFKHLSQKGDLPQQKFSEQQVGIFGKSILDRITLNGALGYNRYGTGFYGLVEGAEYLNEDPQTQVLNDIHFSGELNNNYDPEEHDVSYSVKANAYLFSDQYSAKENSVALSAYFNKAINAFNIGANASVDFTGVKAVDYSLKNNIARLNPYIRFQGTGYKITLGVNFVSEFGDSSRTNLIPKADVEFDVVPEYASIFAGITGDVVKTSLRSISRENPFLNENISIRNQLESTHVYGGIKGNVGSTLGYKAQVFYKEVEDLPLYMNNPASPSRFDLVYLQEGEDKNTIIGFQGEINLRVSETVALGGLLNINEYNFTDDQQAWFMPKIRLGADARINVNEKLLINGALLFNGETQAKTYTYPGTPGDISMLTPVFVDLPAFLDVSAGAEYRINKQIGIYIQANNLLGKTYERYLYYPRLGLNVFGGVNFSF